MLRFYAYYLWQVWPIFAILLLVGLAGALVEVALFSFLADTVDMAQHTAPADFSANTPTRWCGWRSW